MKYARAKFRKHGKSLLRSLTRGSSCASKRNVVSGVAALVLAAAFFPSPLLFAQTRNSSASNSSDSTAPPPVRPIDSSRPSGAPIAPQAVQPLSAIVIEVVGTVEFAPSGVSVLADVGWKPVKVDMRLESGMQIRTALRSHVNLKFGETTVCSIRGATHAGIDQLYRSANAEVVRLGLGYGTIRGGSSEGTIRADLSVESTVATLAKRGTEGWQIHVEPSTGRFNISLAQSGLVEAIQRLGDQKRVSRTVRPGEYATDRTIANMWVNQDIFDRNVTFYDASGLTASDTASMTADSRGYQVMTPGAGTATVDASGRLDAGWVMDQIEARTPAGLRPPATVVIQPTMDAINRPEGNFGTGNSFRVLVPRTDGATRQSTRGLLRRNR
jgi:hypothetical protein